MPKSKKATRKSSGVQPKQTRKVSRREVMRAGPLLGLGVLALAGIGYWGISSITGAMAEQDMSIIGSGHPTIVQVHDPACAPCMALQREARAALATLEEDAIAYRVANIKTPEGLDFAAKHGASYTTLLFFDGEGQVARRIVGETHRNTLRAAFLSHLAAE